MIVLRWILDFIHFAYLYSIPYLNDLSNRMNIDFPHLKKWVWDDMVLKEEIRSICDMHITLFQHFTIVHRMNVPFPLNSTYIHTWSFQRIRPITYSISYILHTARLTGHVEYSWEQPTLSHTEDKIFSGSRRIFKL